MTEKENKAEAKPESKPKAKPKKPAAPKSRFNVSGNRGNTPMSR